MERLAWIGFGEAGTALASVLSPRGSIGFDRKTADPAQRAAKLADFARHGVEAAGSAADAVKSAAAILSLVTADQALAAAQAAAPHLKPGALWFDMNSVAPDTKRAAAATVEAAGARYIDVAILAPVLPARATLPLLVSGDHAETGTIMLHRLGFVAVTVLPGGVGTASAVKMIRSVMVKGIEALSAECVLAADVAGVRPAVIASLDATWPGGGWEARFDYALDRMMMHGLRRAAEMEEVVATLHDLGIAPAMSARTRDWQQRIGGLELVTPSGLNAKLAVLRERLPDRAA